MKKFFRLLLNLIRWLVVVYVIILIALVISEDSLVFHPHKAEVSPQDYNLPMDKIELYSGKKLKITGWYHPAEKNEGTILYFHGNGGHLRYRNRKFRSLINRGFGLLALSYRGYGESEGKPSEEGFYEDARAAVKYAKNSAVLEDNLIFYGESIGTGVASKMAEEFSAKALVLEGAYTSVPDLAQEIYPFFPVYWLVRNRFNNIDRLENVDEPVLIFHGMKDDIVPISHGRRLLEKVTSRKMGVFFEKNGHNNNNIEETSRILRDFLYPN